MRTIEVYLRLTDRGAVEVTQSNKSKGVKSFIIRNQPVTLAVHVFENEDSATPLTKSALEGMGCSEWLLSISKNHSLSFPVYLQPDYDEENPPVTVSEDGTISIVLATTDTAESSEAIRGMQFDMWEAELTALPAAESEDGSESVPGPEAEEQGEGTEEETSEETEGEEEEQVLPTDRQPVLVLQWKIGYTNRVASEAADPPGLAERYYYTITQVNALLAAMKREISETYVDGNELYGAISEALSKYTPFIHGVTRTSDLALSPDPGKTYIWTIPADATGTISFDGTKLPEEGTGTEADIYITLSNANSEVNPADDGTVTIQGGVPSSGWYTLSAQNSNGEVTAILYPKGGQTVLSGGCIDDKEA